MDRLDRLQLFTRIVEGGSFAGAACDLNVAPPTPRLRGLHGQFRYGRRPRTAGTRVDPGPSISLRGRFGIRRLYRGAGGVPPRAASPQCDPFGRPNRITPIGCVSRLGRRSVCRWSRSVRLRVSRSRAKRMSASPPDSLVTRIGGWGGIRTHETVPRLAVFKTAAFNHSATHPEVRDAISVARDLRPTSPSFNGDTGPGATGIP